MNLIRDIPEIKTHYNNGWHFACGIEHFSPPTTYFVTAEKRPHYFKAVAETYEEATTKIIARLEEITKVVAQTV